MARRPLRVTRNQIAQVRGYLAGLVVEILYAASLAVVAFVVALVVYMVWR